jgi:hypothetical protein
MYHEVLVTYTELIVNSLSRLYLARSHSNPSLHCVDPESQGVAAILWTTIFATPTPAVSFNAASVLTDHAQHIYRHMLRKRTSRAVTPLKPRMARSQRSSRRQSLTGIVTLPALDSITDASVHSEDEAPVQPRLSTTKSTGQLSFASSSSMVPNADNTSTPPTLTPVIG